MTGWAWAVLCLVGMFLSIALGDLVSEEIRGWLDLVPQAILRLAANRLDPESREFIYQDDWLPELTYVLRGAESRPITRLIRGTSFALGLLVSARKIGAAPPTAQVGKGAVTTATSVLAGTASVSAVATVIEVKAHDSAKVTEAQSVRRMGHGDLRQAQPDIIIWTSREGNGA